MIYQRNTEIWLPLALVDEATGKIPQTTVTDSQLIFKYGVMSGAGTWSTFALVTDTNLVEQGNGAYEIRLRGQAGENDTNGVLHYAVLDNGAGVLPYYGAVDIVEHDPAADIASILTAVGTLSSDLAVVAANALLAVKILNGDWEIVGKQLKMFDTDGGGALLYTFDLLDSTGSPTDTEPFKRQRA